MNNRTFLLCMMGLFILFTGCTQRHEGEIQPPYSSSTAKGKNYTDVEKVFKKSGFDNIQLEKVEDLIFGWLNEDGEVKEVSIDGETEFTTSKWFPQDAEVVIRYHTFPARDDAEAPGESTKSENVTPAANNAEENPVSPDDANATTDNTKDALSYTTNDSAAAKKGDTGIYAYKSRGGSYTIYYIIDFDEGYVYRFVDGNGDGTCDRVKIESGTLNDVAIITYHAGSDSWSYGMHFKWKNQPDHLVVQDEYGYEDDYYNTNLRNALEIRDTKQIFDYS